MDYHSLDKFRDEIELIEQFFTELAANEDELLTYGLRRATLWESFGEVKEVLPTFEARIFEFMAFVRPIDRALHEDIKELIRDSRLAESVASMQVALRVAAKRKRLGVKGELASALLFHLPYISNFVKRRRLFSEEVVPVQTILVALGRLRNLVAMAGDIYIRRWSRDSDVFRPSNLDEGKILEYIEAAASELESNAALPEDERKQLIEYLYKAKSELSQERPSWNKIITYRGQVLQSSR